MAFKKICCSNKTCKAEENLYGIILAGDAGRQFVYVEPPKIAADGLDPYAKFIDGQSLFELTLRRTKKALSPKRLFVLVNRERLDGDEVRAQLNERAQHSLVWQPRGALRVLPARGVYWSELSNRPRQEQCLSRMIGIGAPDRPATGLA